MPLNRVAEMAFVVAVDRSVYVSLHSLFIYGSKVSLTRVRDESGTFCLDSFALQTRLLASVVEECSSKQEKDAFKM